MNELGLFARRLRSFRGLSFRCAKSLHKSCVKHERFRTTAVPLRPRKASKLPEDKHKSHFVDWMRVRVSAGSGGDGCISVASVFKNEFAGPDGGDGGNGAHVIFRASSISPSLAHLKSVMKAANGVSGKEAKCDGKNASHLIVDVPMGTVFRNLDREVVAELVEDGSMFLAARGGAGGKGNTFFKSSTRQTPMLAETGGKGECFTFDIEMRTMAHVGLVGFPNAGKSSLLQKLSRARPKVAAYPFTTLKPHIGIVEYDDNKQLAIADIPGLIPDAHKNRGLGIDFLRHIERCLCLLYVIDLSQPNPHQQLECLKYELEQYASGLSSRPHGVVANKMDLDEARQNLPDFVQRINNLPVYTVSAKFGTNVDQLLYFIRDMYDDHTKLSAEQQLPDH